MQESDHEGGSGTAASPDGKLVLGAAGDIAMIHGCHPGRALREPGPIYP